MLHATLTDTFVRNVECPWDEDRVEYEDNAADGLTLIVHRSGVKTFVFNFLDESGRRRQHRIGSFPNISVEAAQREVDRLVDDWTTGMYPPRRKWPKGLKPWQADRLERACLDIADAIGCSASWVEITAPTI
jgi:hypothetical protein